jgi:PilZ domain
LFTLKRAFTLMAVSPPSSALAAAAERLSRARARPAERRRFRRLPIVVGGRMLDAYGREHDCRTADISPGDARLAAAVTPEAGERVVVYLEGLGRIAGRVARRCGEAEFAIIFETSVHKRERIAETLTWLINRSGSGVEAPERQPAREPAQRARLRLDSGEEIEGEIVDFSLAGMNVRTAAPAPPVGVWVRIGGAYGRVARHLEGGFAVDFEFPNPPARAD